MSLFGRKAKIFLLCIVLVLAAAAGYWIEHHDGETFIEETSTSAVDDEYFSISTHIIDGKININSAEPIELCELEGIGEKLAERIVEYRTKNGPFKQIEGIMLVPGIGEKLFGEVKDKICAQ